MSILNDLGDRLSSQGAVTGALPTGDLSLGLLPSTPDDVTALLLTAGPAPVRAMGPARAQVERPHVQCLARGARPENALKRAQDAYSALDGLGSATINGVLYLYCRALQYPFEVGRDEAGRFIYGVNFELQRVPATSS